MLSLRSIRREADVMPGGNLGSPRKILRGLKATQDEAAGGRVVLGLRPQSEV